MICDIGALKLNVGVNPILIRVNLSHALQKKGSLFSTQTLKHDTSKGNSSLIANQDEIEIKTFPNCSIYCLKHLIMKLTNLPICD